MSRDVVLFVYGSLLRGESAEDFLRDCELVGEAATTAEYELVDLGAYPALLDGGPTSVCGELFIVSPEVIAELDEYEDHPQMYRRQSVSLTDGRVAVTYLYVRDRLPGRPRVISGDWRKRPR